MNINLGRYEISSRTIKTLLALIIIMIVMELIGQGDSGTMIAGVSAIVVLRDTVKIPAKAAPGRLIGQALGGALALLFFFIYDGTGYQFWVKVVLITVMVLIIMIVLNRFELYSGIVGGNATFLMVTLSIPVGSALAYCGIRIIDSFIGVLIAIIVNSFWVEKEIVKAEQKADKVIEKINKY